MVAHPHEQALEGLARAVDADVRLRGGRQHPPHGVEGLGPGGLAVDEVAVARLLGHRRPHVVVDSVDEVGVRVEQAVHVPHVPGAERRGQDGRIPVVAVAPAEPGVVGDVPRALLQVAGQPSPLQHLREQVRRLLAGQVDPSELGHGVVAVLEEDLLVELLGPLEADGGVERLVSGHVELADELVEEEPAEALRAPGVPGEERSLHHFGQVDQGEHRPVEVGEVAPEEVLLLGGEGLRHVQRHEGSC